MFDCQNRLIKCNSDQLHLLELIQAFHSTPNWCSAEAEQSVCTGIPTCAHDHWSWIESPCEEPVVRVLIAVGTINDCAHEQTAQMFT